MNGISNAVYSENDGPAQNLISNTSLPMSTEFKPPNPSQTGQPTWEVVQLMPRQGEWNEADFFELHTNKMAELVNGS